MGTLKASEPAPGTLNASRASDRARTMRTVVFSGLVGFGVGLFWLAFAVVFFTAPERPFVTIVSYAAVITCPPLFFGRDLLVAPFWNAPLYATISYLFTLARR